MRLEDQGRQCVEHDFHAVVVGINVRRLTSVGNSFGKTFQLSHNPARETPLIAFTDPKSTTLTEPTDHPQSTGRS